MEKSIKEITNKYLKEKTLQAFSDALGIPSSRQMVFHWKEGSQEPSPMTLFSIISSPEAQGWAKAWAGDCLAVIQQRSSKRVVMVHGSDGVNIVDPDFGNK